ncbi:MAG: DUF3316 domain-containing protein, partial [Muribaculaceae bacterium]|nr:DUF3316 domain-containing protein [Muribaculaceae bacterium]
MRRVLILITAVLIAANLRAGDTLRVDKPLRPVTSAFTLDLGSSHLRDTYLTPLAYSGWVAGVGYERFQAMAFDPENWIMRLEGRVSATKGENPTHSATMWSFEFSPSWAMMRRFNVRDNIRLAVGGKVSLDGGMLYLSRNGNNPVSARASLTVGLTAMATWNVNLGRLPVTFRLQPSLPITGIFFSPDYDELYYEIWLGNHAGLCHAAWPGNFLRLENLLTADLRLGNTNLRLGYRFELRSTSTSGIVTRRVDHAFVIGVSTEWLSLRPLSRKHIRP